MRELMKKLISANEEKMMDEYVIEQILDEMIEELNILEHP